MQEQRKSESEINKSSTTTFLASASVIYSVMAVTGALISIYVHGSFAEVTRVSRDLLLESAVLGGLGAGVLLILNYLLADFFPAYQEFKRMLVTILGPLSLVALVFLALVSSIGEELLFRVAIQPSFGLVATSIIFGLLHMGPGGGISIWSLWALCAGLLIGWMFQRTGVIWGPVLCHFLVNAISMTRIRLTYIKETGTGDGKMTDEE
ncbi:MAG: lysostaphin resistance A-like protein [Oligoflexales bacterium]